MATYFHGSNEIQPESMQTLYLMNPNFTSYSNAQANLIQLPYPQAQAQAQYLVGIPVQSNNGLSLSLPMAEITTQVSVVRNESANISGLQSVLSNSKYLKFAQQLLDEVVSVGKGSRDGSMKSNGDGNHLDRGHENEKGPVELSISERQELLMKKAKLVNMLDEVIQRYKQYHQQMQLVVSSFEAAAGLGSAKSYTALALQTMSKQFRSLRDAITGKIRTTARSLGEEDFNERGSNSKGSRLQFVDQQVRQQRALQQLGMIHSNAWRPQRGLPERSVSVLRAWLFEHFLHPYPKDSDKKMLAKQAGLTRSQVSNWFINARVRLWKPMVEEMYKEEMKEHEQINADERTSETDVNKDSSLKSNAHEVNNPPPPTITIPLSSMEVHNKDDDMFIQSKLKKALSEAPMNRDDHESNGNYHERGGFVEYSNHIGEIERFGLEQFASRLSGNSISLTLGLTHYDGLSLSGSQPAFLSNSSIPFGATVEIGSENNAFSNLNSSLSVAHPSSNAYESISIETRKRFESQMLPQLY